MKEKDAHQASRDSSAYIASILSEALEEDDCRDDNSVRDRS